MSVMSKTKFCQMCFEVEAMFGSNVCKECDDMMNFTFVNKDGHLDLDKALEEIIWIYNEYGLANDEDLEINAIELKHKILNVVNKIKKLG